MPGEVQPGKPCIDLSRYELTIDGRRIKLERQPMELLILFAERQSQLVSREEIIEKLWGKDVFVDDADRSLNAAVRKIRSALRDDFSAPRYLETVIGKGYRLVGEVEVVPAAVPRAISPTVTRPQVAQGHPKRSRVALQVVLIAAVVMATWAIWHWQRRVSVQPDIHSIAVLPLANLSGDPSQNYFADGMTEELTTDLGKVTSLHVISRTSAQRYRDSSKSAPQIARDLNVQAVVEGSVLRSGNKVRITVQLIDAAHDKHLWAESYERDLGDIIAVQNTVALEIARQVRTRLTPADQQRLQHTGPVDPNAYDAYLRGRYSQSTQSAEGLKEGLPAFQKAIELDPGYAPAYAGLADTYSLLANYGVLPPSEAFPQAAAAARKALELDPTSAEAHTALAYSQHHYAWDWAAAEREYKTAISLSPSYSTAHLRYAEYISSVGRHDEAIVEMHRALDLDPLSSVYRNNLGRFLYHARRYDEAIEVLTQSLAVDPSRAYARIHLALSYDEKGMYSQALEQFKQVQSSFGGPAGPGLAHLYARSGESAEARKIVTQLRRGAGDSDWFFIAGVYAALGDKNEAFACLEKAYKKHDFFLVFLKVHPYMDPLRSDPRYVDLLHRIKLDTAGH